VAKSTCFAPDGLFSVEAAGFLKPNKALAKTIIDKCLENEAARFHCQDYANRLATGKLRNTGILGRKLNKYLIW
jgi:hypothetical protein